MPSPNDSVSSLLGSSPDSTVSPSLPLLPATPFSDLNEELYSKSGKEVLEHCLVQGLRPVASIVLASTKENLHDVARGNLDTNCMLFALHGPEVTVSNEVIVAGWAQVTLEDLEALDWLHSSIKGKPLLVAAMADLGSPTPFGELKSHFAKRNFNDLEILHHCLGLKAVEMKPSMSPNVANTRTIAQDLAKHSLLVCIDVEHYTLNSDEMTEIGVGVIDTEESAMVSHARQFGDHGQNLMQLAHYHHFRLIEKSHLLTTNVKSRGAEGNRFGKSRFVTFSEARDILQKILVQPITTVKALKGFNRPVVIMGHAIKNDCAHLNGKDLGFDIDGLGTIIRVIDTQQIAVDCKFWHHPTDPIGLRALVNKLEFDHTDAHTAANDAARTMICAILMAVPKQARKGCGRSVNEVARLVETYSQGASKALGGTAEYCSKCGSTTHVSKACNEKGLLHCDECVSRGLDELSMNHIPLHCPIVRDEVVAERHKWYDDQLWTPKYPFTSRNRLQTFAPNAPKVQPATPEEIAARRQHYDKQRNSRGAWEAFTWAGRSFDKSPQHEAGMPQGSHPISPKGPHKSAARSGPSDGISGLGRGGSSNASNSRGTSATRARGGIGRGRSRFLENTSNEDF
ncbi:hypothetical protein DE146DRAFT_760629 [Phaeosphaeria sp. MPI-PUGE-AT-0046c]|nr:hypothetical protein DE146DRAFT_760629 [Phaeosphaeria sp. MPI-PUGE-AT-0046c]